MLTSVQLKNGTTLMLENKALGSGGEGDVFKIIHPIDFHSQVVKIYKPEKRTIERERKIQYLANNAPKLESHEGHNSIIWVNQLVFNHGKFCGFTMPIAKGEKLELLCHPRLPKSLSKEWQKFDLQNPESHNLRLKLCFNIAVSLFHIHQLNNYVLVDMKPENIVVQSNGLVSIIDTDSVAVVKNGKSIFLPPVSTPDYTPPEFYKGTELDSNKLNETWDRFSMAVIFYRLLCGIHPFTGSCDAPFDKCNSLADMIENGLFPNSPQSKYFKTIPPPHNKFKKLSTPLQDLFKRCFIIGHTNPSIRPSADEWCRNLTPLQNRILPSRVVTFYYNYSKSLIYNPNTSLTIPDVSFYNLQPKRGLKRLLSKLAGNNNEDQLIDDICQSEIKLSEQIKKYNSLESDLKNILIQFEETQKTILEKEESKISILKNRVESEMSILDKKTIELQAVELKELNNTSILLSKTILSIEKKIKDIYNRLLNKKHQEYNKQKSFLHNKINDLQAKERKEIDMLIKNPRKLAAYSIKFASIHNFGESTKKALYSNGIITAADFIGVSTDGFIKKIDGNWIKIQGIGSNRAYDLNRWRQTLDIKENKIIERTINAKYLQPHLLIEKDIKELISTFQKQIKPLELQFHMEKKPLSKQKLEATELYNRTINAIKNKYNIQYNEIINSGKMYISQLTPELDLITKQTELELANCYQKYVSQFNDKKIEIDKYTNELQKDIKELANLHKKLPRP